MAFVGDATPERNREPVPGPPDGTSAAAGHALPASGRRRRRAQAVRVGAPDAAADTGRCDCRRGGGGARDPYRLGNRLLGREHRLREVRLGECHHAGARADRRLGGRLRGRGRDHRWPASPDVREREPGEGIEPDQPRLARRRLDPLGLGNDRRGRARLGALGMQRDRERQLAQRPPGRPAFAAQASSAKAQRVRNGQPEGTFTGEGGSPGSTGASLSAPA